MQISLIRNQLKLANTILLNILDNIKEVFKTKVTLALGFPCLTHKSPNVIFSGVTLICWLVVINLIFLKCEENQCFCSKNY